jgi:hypothetical protein
MLILHGLDLSGTFHRADVSGTLRGPNVERLFLGPDVSRLLLRADVPALLHRPSLYSGIWCRLYRPDLCPCIFLGRPSLELLEQRFGFCLLVFGLALIGGFNTARNFVAGRGLSCSRR